MRDKDRPRFSTVGPDEVKVTHQEQGIQSQSPWLSAFRRGLKMNPRGIHRGTPTGTKFLSDAGTFDTPSSSSGAPADAEYLVAASNATLTQERVTTDTTTVAWDHGTASQAKANVPDHAIINWKLADVSPWTFKGDATGSTAEPQDVAAFDLSQEVAPTAGDFVWVWTDEGGGTFQIKKVDWDDLPGGGGTPHDLLDGTVNQDTLAATVSRGSLVVGNATPKWSELVVGGAGTILKSDGTDAAWGTPAVQQSALLDGGTVHTDTLGAAVARGALILGNATPKWDKLVIGAAGQILRSDGTDAAWARNYGTTVYVPTAGDTDISEVTDVTIATRDVATVAAGDIVIIEGEFIILNDSAATRVYVITLDFDAAFDIEISTGALATSSTLLHPFTFRAVCSIRSTSLAYAVVSVDGQLAAGVAGGGDTTMAATHLSGKGWGTSGSNLTGTLTCDLKIRSANANPTQTCRLVCFEVRRITPGTPSGA